MRVRWFGDRAVLVSTEGPESRERVAGMLESHRTALGPGIDVRRGMRDVLVEAPRPDVHLLEEVRRVLSEVVSESSSSAPRNREHRIDVRYVGEDLSSASRHFGIDSGALAAAHREQVWRVAMLGFAPGFGYLEPVGDLTLPWSSLERRDSPRTRVPRGSVALAAGMSAVYPQDMPGGWHLIGESTAVLFDPHRTRRPSLLGPGDLVRFVEVKS